MPEKKYSKIDKIRHSLSHLLAAAVLEKFPKAKLGIGPVIENGFYYDFLLENSLDTDIFPDIEERMRKLISQNLYFYPIKTTYAKAIKIFKNQPFKAELIKELKKQRKPISIYITSKKIINDLDKAVENAVFFDLCEGKHIKNTKEINPSVFKLNSVSGAYWRGSEKNPQMQRIYGLAFKTKKELDSFIKQQEDAKKRDHRALGEKLKLFIIDNEIGKGLPLWMPNGYFIRRKMEDYMYNLQIKNGYKYVLTPIIAKEELYKKSGHLAHYKNDMYAPIEIENEKYYLKPMNCPDHHSIYKSEKRSYRDLPLRLAEFGMVHRYERSGVLSGLIRVRGFTQDDAHIYTTQEQLSQEIASVLNLHKKVYRDFNIKNYWYRLSLPDFKNKEKFGDIKNKDIWRAGERILRKALREAKHKFVEAKGEASFYGPKIDIQIKDIYGREDTIGTVQVDYYSAPRFNLHYTDNKGSEKMPVIVHRAIMGSFERFFAFFTEQTAGYFPVWLSPVQAIILPVSKKYDKYADYVKNLLLKENIMAGKNVCSETLGKRIMEAESQKIPYILIVGEREKTRKTVNVRHYKRGVEGEWKINRLIKKIKEDIDKKI